MVLIGVIVGYGAATVSGGSVNIGGANKPSVAAQPTPAAPTPAPAPAPAGEVPEVDPDQDYIRGDEDALITVIEYSDFECPFCSRHHPTMKQLVAEVDDVNWVLRHYPLGFHPNAQKASEASECAGEQGKFWEYADMLFEKGADNTQLETYAADLGLDAGDFKDCLDSGKYAQKVTDQMAGGTAAGIRGTPGNIVINNETGKSQIVSGAQPLEAFKAAVEALK